MGWRVIGWGDKCAYARNSEGGKHISINKLKDETQVRTIEELETSKEKKRPEGSGVKGWGKTRRK